MSGVPTTLETTAEAASVYKAKLVEEQSSASPTLNADESGVQQRHVAHLRERHWTMLIVCLGVVIAAPLLTIREGGRVGASWLPTTAFPPMCGSRALLGVECPGCGLTRSFVALAAGDVARSLQFHRVGWVMAAAVVLQIPYRIYALRELRTKNPNRTWPVWFGHALIAMLVINWLVKLL